MRKHPHFVREANEPTANTPAVDDTEHSRARRSQDTSLRTPPQAMQNKDIEHTLGTAKQKQSKKGG